MNSGAFDKWLEQRSDGWWACQLGGNWSMEFGPYRWRWQAWLSNLLE